MFERTDAQQDIQLLVSYEIWPNGAEIEALKEHITYALERNLIPDALKLRTTQRKIQFRDGGKAVIGSYESTFILGELDIAIEDLAKNRDDAAIARLIGLRNQMARIEGRDPKDLDDYTLDASEEG